VISFFFTLAFLTHCVAQLKSVQTSDHYQMDMLTVPKEKQLGAPASLVVTKVLWSAAQQLELVWSTESGPGYKQHVSVSLPIENTGIPVHDVSAITSYPNSKGLYSNDMRQE